MVIDVWKRTETESGAIFERKSRITRATNVEYKDSFYEAGDFSITLAAGAVGARSVEVGSFLQIDLSFWGEVKDIAKDLSDSESSYKISGVSVKWAITSSRIVVPTDYITVDGSAGYDTANGYTDAVIKHFWRNNISQPTQAKRAIPGVVVAPDKEVGLATDKYMSRFENVADVTSTLCKNAKIGFCAAVNPAAGTVTLDCVAGVNRTSAQSDNQRAVFSVGRKNIAKLNYSISAEAHKNAYYTTKSGAEFVDEALTLLYFENDEEKSGLSRKEFWQEVSVEEPIAGDEYAELKKQAQKAMKDREIKEGFSCEILPNSGYREIWNVGDTVTVRWEEEGIEADLQVTDVSVSSDSDSINYVAKFGDGKPRLFVAGRKIIKI